MSTWLTLLGYVLFAGLGPMLAKLGQLEPSWSQWISLLTPVLAAVGAGLHLDGPAMRAKLRRAGAASATKLLACVAVPLALSGASVACEGCSGTQVPAPIVQAGADFAVCVLTHAIPELVSGTPVTKVVQDSIDACGCPGTSDPTACASAVNQIIDAEQKARTLAVDAGH